MYYCCECNIQIDCCRVVCNPRGYVAWTGKVKNRDFDAKFVVTV